MSAPSIKNRHLFLFLAVQTLLIATSSSVAMNQGIPFSNPTWREPGNQAGLNPHQQAQVAAAHYFEQMKLREQQEKTDKKP